MESNENRVETSAHSSAPVQQSNSTGTAAMWLGIASIIIAFIPLISIISPVLAILAIVFGVKAKKQGAGGMATAGIVTGAIALVIFVIGLIFSLIVGAAILSEF